MLRYGWNWFRFMQCMDFFFQYYNSKKKTFIRFLCNKAYFKTFYVFMHHGLEFKDFTYPQKDRLLSFT